ncbi:hypothetical protein [Antarctobacter heliothermus]|uniref:Uncharacterized protein n=1 Tax=Antarctobacter heliothermus TaxID=74033 RepID=A0A239C104_9RHOB|nr:hypothetical protein [Antarctobacter heliothermus]SNS13995.1 hypothetical protein SAMN04488078_100564 [Antarctobacter heliothermus]
MRRCAYGAAFALLAAQAAAEGQGLPDSALLLQGFDPDQIVGVSPPFTASPIELLMQNPTDILRNQVPDFTLPDSTRDGGVLMGDNLRGLDPLAVTHARLVWIEIDGEVYCITETSTQDLAPDS